MPKILDGKQLAQVMQAEIAAEVAGFVAKKGIKPGLAAVLVGGDPASQIYVRNKRKACAQAGMDSWLHERPAETTQAQLLELVDQLNRDPRVHGILVQLPLPAHIKEPAVIRAVAPMKDIDGFSPENLGLLIAGQPRYVPCTPFGIQQLLVRNQVPIEGRHVVMVGRSNIVGKPLAMMLAAEGSRRRRHGHGLPQPQPRSAGADPAGGHSRLSPSARHGSSRPTWSSPAWRSSTSA